MSTVRSVDLENGRIPGVISRRKLRTQRARVERALAWSVLAAGWIGSLAAGAGGFERIVALQISVTGLSLALLLQAVLTWLQWSYDDTRTVSWPARAIDATMTAAGYGPLAVGALAGWLAPALAERGALVALPASGVTTPTAGAWLIMWLIGLGIAWYPETRLVRD